MPIPKRKARLAATRTGRARLALGHRLDSARITARRRQGRCVTCGEDLKYSSIQQTFWCSTHGDQSDVSRNRLMEEISITSGVPRFGWEIRCMEILHSVGKRLTLSHWLGRCWECGLIRKPSIWSTCFTTSGKYVRTLGFSLRCPDWHPRREISDSTALDKKLRKHFGVSQTLVGNQRSNVFEAMSHAHPWKNFLSRDEHRRQKNERAKAIEHDMAYDFTTSRPLSRP